MSVYTLTIANFQLQQGKQKKALHLQIPGNVLVYFKDPNSSGCMRFEQYFNQLVHEENRVKYGILNVIENREIIRMSQSTTAPIQVTPTLIMYNNGRPLAMYTGNKSSVPAMRSFISNILSKSTSGYGAPPAHTSTPPQYQQQFMGGQRNSGGGGGNDSSGGLYGTTGQQKSRVWMPEIDEPTTMSGLKGGRSKHAYHLDDDEDDATLLLPDELTPYNTPWDTPYKRGD